MNQSQVERAVARATGESRRFIKRLGFSLIDDEPDHSVDPGLVIDCPGCGVVFNLHGVSLKRQKRDVRINVTARQS
jgi:hypothetical protein